MTFELDRNETYEETYKEADDEKDDLHKEEAESVIHPPSAGKPTGVEALGSILVKAASSMYEQGTVLVSQADSQSTAESKADTISSNSKDDDDTVSSRGDDPSMADTSMYGGATVSTRGDYDYSTVASRAETYPSRVDTSVYRGATASTRGDHDYSTAVSRADTSESGTEAGRTTIGSRSYASGTEAGRTTIGSRSYATGVSTWASDKSEEDNVTYDTFGTKLKKKVSKKQKGNKQLSTKRCDQFMF
jgi:hypothetical protein